MGHARRTGGKKTGGEDENGKRFGGNGAAKARNRDIFSHREASSQEVSNTLELGGGGRRSDVCEEKVKRKKWVVLYIRGQASYGVYARGYCYSERKRQNEGVQNDRESVRESGPTYTIYALRGRCRLRSPKARAGYSQKGGVGGMFREGLW